MKVDLDTARRFFAMAPHMADLGIVPISISEGRVTTELVIEPKHLQHSKVVHAGVIASMADHTMGAAAQTLAPDDALVLTAELKTSMLRASRGERIVCEAWVIKAGRTISFTEAEVYAVQGPDRTLVVKASATMALAPMPPGLDTL